MMTLIEHSKAAEMEISRNLMASAIGLCFGDGKSDPLGKELKRISESDPDEETDTNLMDMEALRKKFMERNPHLVKRKAQVQHG
jgi:hypothetical protein